MNQETEEPKNDVNVQEESPAVEPAPPVVDAKDVEEGKTFAVLSWVLSLVGIPFFLVPLIMRNNAYSLFHAKQCLMLWLFGIAGGIISSILMFVCIGLILWIAVIVAWLVFAIMGIISATKGEMKPLPLIGAWGVDWFKGIQKV